VKPKTKRRLLLAALLLAGLALTGWGWSHLTESAAQAPDLPWDALLDRARARGLEVHPYEADPDGPAAVLVDRANQPDAQPFGGAGPAPGSGVCVLVEMPEAKAARDRGWVRPVANANVGRYYLAGDLAVGYRALEPWGPRSDPSQRSLTW
jgi:hypothetical protein